jgi:hypothetical protein
MKVSAEQQARDLLEACGVEDAQSFTAGDVVALANYIAENGRANVNQVTYVVVENGMEYTEIKRVYATRSEAEAFVAAYNAVETYHLEVEEHPIGAPLVEYDGPVWTGTWSARRKLVGEKQLVLINAEGFATIVPSATPTGAGTYRYQEHFAGWRDLAQPPEYAEPPVWIDSFRTSSGWHTGDKPPDAAIETRQPTQVTVKGTSKDAVEALLRQVALEYKAALVGEVQR